MTDAHSLKLALTGRCEDVVRFLLPGAVHHGNYFKAGSVRGEAGNSLSVCVSGAKRGLWMDGNSADDAGDLLDLWCRARGQTLREVLPEVRQWLGIHEVVGRKLPRKQYVQPNGNSIAPLAPINDKVRNYLVRARRLNPRIIADFRVGHKPGREETMAFPYFDEKDELQMVKYIDTKRDARGKKVVSVTPGGKPILYGMSTKLVRNSPDLLICEGEIDAMTWQGAGIAAVSVPFGAKNEASDGSSPNDEWIENCFEFLGGYRSIYLSMDEDEEGAAALDSLIKRLGTDRCRIVKLPRKDANDCIMNDVALKPLFSAATERQPDNLAIGSSLIGRVSEVLAAGDRSMQGIPIFDWPYGWRLRPREGTIVTGYNNHGKSNFCYGLFSWLACVKGQQCFIGSYEEPVEQILAIMATQAAGRQLDVSSDLDLIAAIRDKLLANIIVHDYEGTVPHKTYFELAEYASRRFGAKWALFDSVTCSDVDLDDKADMDAFAKNCQAFWKRTGVHLFLIAHPRKGLTENIPPLKLDVKGSGGLTDLFFNVCTIYKSQHETNEGRIIMSKQKVGGVNPRQHDHPIYFHPPSMRFTWLAEPPTTNLQPWITQ